MRLPESLNYRDRCPRKEESRSVSHDRFGNITNLPQEVINPPDDPHHHFCSIMEDALALEPFVLICATGKRVSGTKLGPMKGDQTIIKGTP